MVARGGFEPPKPLGRQIYSLLRLTAPQPRQMSPAPSRAATSPRPRRSIVTWNSLEFDATLQTAVVPEVPPPNGRPMELAEGFEPPTG